MAVEEITYNELANILIEEGYSQHHRNMIDIWLNRGDGAALYRNHDLGHPEVGHLQVVSFGSEAAQLEVDEPPTTLPDIGNTINWRYVLTAFCRSPQVDLGDDEDLQGSGVL